MALRTLIPRKTLASAAVKQGYGGLGFVQSRSLQTFTLPDLPYDYGALEPAISGEIMQLHHHKHHQTYITNYNKALEQLDDAMAKGDASTVVKLQSAIKFNGGGPVLSRFVFCALFGLSKLARVLEMSRIVTISGKYGMQTLRLLGELMSWHELAICYREIREAKSYNNGNEE
ncbi:hypothetical protein Cgig2_003727 [Carnegiea gigantea]|uniref:superoxide dismutase n=1 Tax=Carnegiea gigantea TaxID=171969 RepID=A0A9Q1KH02_9CARY|nr:hypothetical protein Cgig2_003727 [Carnegiea gigantea]